MKKEDFIGQLRYKLRKKKFSFTEIVLLKNMYKLVSSKVDYVPCEFGLRG
jgi:hypothetical protein